MELVEEMPFWAALATESYGKLFHLEDVDTGTVIVT